MSLSPQPDARKGRWIELRSLVPMIIAIGFMADVGLRFVPPARLAHRAWEPVSAFPGEGPFAPNAVYDNERAYGDLPGIANLPSLRVYRPEHFTSDAVGYRNTPGSEGRPIRVIVVGDSFTGGASLSDADTLSAQLSGMAQIGVYNAGPTWTWSAVDGVIKRLHLSGGLVVWQISERVDIPIRAGEPVKLEVRILKALFPENSRWYANARMALRIANGFYRYSPLQILTTRLFFGIENDRWLPNPPAHSVVMKTLSNGQEMAFFVDEIQNFARKRPTAPDYFIDLQKSIKATGNKMVVLMVPDKYNVYYPLLKGSPTPPPEGNSMFGMLAKNLRWNGVPVLDLTPAFRQQAARDLRDGRYLYWMDDTHWSPIGVKVAAGELLKYLRESGLEETR